MPTATVTSKGQITIPKRVRDALHVKPGDRVDFVIEDGGRVVVRSGIGRALHRPGRRAVTLARMREVIARRHRKRA